MHVANGNLPESCQYVCDMSLMSSTVVAATLNMCMHDYVVCVIIYLQYNPSHHSLASLNNHWIITDSTLTLPTPWHMAIPMSTGCVLTTTASIAAANAANGQVHYRNAVV
jgi:hypothetical protein